MELEVTVRGMWCAVPPSWRAALPRAAGTLSPGPPSWAPSTPAVTLLLERLGWGSGKRRVALAGQREADPADSSGPPGLSVQLGTQLLTLAVADQRSAARTRFARLALSLSATAGPAPSEADVDSAAHALHTAMRTLWRLPWDNRHKETLWRMSVVGVQAAGGHDIVLGPCPCGWEVPAAAADGALAYQAHVFWECPVATAVRATLASALPPATPLPCAAVWLLRPPGDRPLHAGVWQVVCAAAVRAMAWGRRYLWAKTHDSSTPVDVTQRLITDFFAPVTAVAPPPAGQAAGALPQACRLAVSHFWSSLLEFTELYSGLVPSEWPRPWPGPTHPFMGVVGVEAMAHLQLNLPPGVAWDALS